MGRGGGGGGSTASLDGCAAVGANHVNAVLMNCLCLSDFADGFAFTESQRMGPLLSCICLPISLNLETGSDGTLSLVCRAEGLMVRDETNIAPISMSLLYNGGGGAGDEGTSTTAPMGGAGGGEGDADATAAMDAGSAPGVRPSSEGRCTSSSGTAEVAGTEKTPRAGGAGGSRQPAAEAAEKARSSRGGGDRQQGGRSSAAAVLPGNRPSTSPVYKGSASSSSSSGIATHAVHASALGPTLQGNRLPHSSLSLGRAGEGEAGQLPAYASGDGGEEGTDGRGVTVQAVSAGASTRGSLLRAACLRRQQFEGPRCPTEAQGAPFPHLEVDYSGNFFSGVSECSVKFRKCRVILLWEVVDELFHWAADVVEKMPVFPEPPPPPAPLLAARRSSSRAAGRLGGSSGVSDILARQGGGGQGGAGGEAGRGGQKIDADGAVAVVGGEGWGGDRGAGALDEGGGSVPSSMKSPVGPSALSHQRRSLSLCSRDPRAPRKSRRGLDGGEDYQNDLTSCRRSLSAGHIETTRKLRFSSGARREYFETEKDEFPRYVRLIRKRHEGAARESYAPLLRYLRQKRGTVQQHSARGEWGGAAPSPVSRVSDRKSGREGSEVRRLNSPTGEGGGGGRRSLFDFTSFSPSHKTKHRGTSILFTGGGQEIHHPHTLASGLAALRQKTLLHPRQQVTKTHLAGAFAPSPDTHYGSSTGLGGGGGGSSLRHHSNTNSLVSQRRPSTSIQSIHNTSVPSGRGGGRGESRRGRA